MENTFGIIYNKDLKRVRNGLSKLAGLDCSASLSLIIIKNIRLINVELESLEELRKPSDEYTNVYQLKAEEIAKKYCKKDPMGNPIPSYDINGAPMYDFEPSEKINFDSEISMFEREIESSPEHKDIFLKRAKDLQKYNESLELPCDIQLKKIPSYLLPPVFKPNDWFNDIFELVEE